MGRTMLKQTRKVACPSCGTTIHSGHNRNSIWTCPRCGEWVDRRSWLAHRLEIVNAEARSSAFGESDEWEKSLTQ